MRNKLITLALLFLVLVGCTGEKNIFNVEGTIEEINSKEQQIYVDGFWLPVKNVEDYNIGDVVSAEVESTAEGDQYVPEKAIVKKIEIKESSKNN